MRSPEDEAVIAELMEDLQRCGPGPARLRAMASLAPGHHELLVAAILRLDNGLPFDPDATSPLGTRRPSVAEK